VTKKLFDPGLLAEGDLPVVVVPLEQARDVENLAMERLGF